MRQVILLLVFGFLGSTSLAQDLLISQATLHVGDGETIIENTDILIADGRIAEIAPRIPTNKSILKAQSGPIPSLTSNTNIAVACCSVI